MNEDMYSSEKYNLEPKGINEYSFIADEKSIIPSREEIESIHMKRVVSTNFGNIDFRLLKAQGLSGSTANKMFMTIDKLPELKADCSKDIADATQLMIKECPLFLPNKAYNIDPSKWFLLVFEKSKYLCFGKQVALDIDENYYFEKIGLKNPKDRADKLALVTAYHDAMKGGNSRSIQYNTNLLKSEWFGYLLDKGIKLWVDTSHEVYWSAVNYSLLPVYYEWYGTIPVSDWFLYPYNASMIKKFSVAETNMYMNIGPPIDLSKDSPYPGKVLCEIGVYIKYNLSFFGGKLSLERNGKKYL
jgi:hypothetical protein